MAKQSNQEPGSSSTPHPADPTFLDSLTVNGLLHALGTAVVVIDVEGKIVYWNERAESLYGWTAEEAKGRSTYDILVPEDSIDEASDIMARLRAGETWSGRFTVRTKAGNRLPIHITDSPLFDEQGNLTAIIGVSVDDSARARLEQEIDERERFIRSVADSAPLHIYLYDVQTRKNVWTNRANADMLGIGEKHRAGQILSRIHPDDVSSLTERTETLQKSPDNATLECEYRIRDADNSYRWMLDRGRVFKRRADGTVEQVLGTAVDITALKEAEERIRHSEFRFRRLLENLPLGFALLERVKLTGKPVDFRFLDLNSAFEAHTGMPRAAALKQTLRQIEPGIDPDHLRFLETALTRQDAERATLYAESLDRWFRVTAYSTEADRVAVIYEDVSRDVKRQEALRHSEDLMYTTGSIARIGGWELDLDAETVEWTRITAEIHETGEERVHDLEHAVKFYHEEYRPIVRDSLKETIENRTPMDFQARIRTRSGKDLWVHARGGPTREVDGRITHVGGTFQDITEHRKQEEKRKAYEERLWQTQKLESLGVLAGGIAHDFNNLLVGILGNADLTLDEIGTDHPATPFLRDIMKAASRASELSRQMLMYSGKASYQFGTVDVSRMIREMTHMVELSIHKSIVLRLRLSESLPPVHADLDQMRQVVMNLVMNASEAIGDRSGAISVTTGVMECDRDYLGTTSVLDECPEGYYTYIEVSDTGEGIDPANLERIFDPFFTTRFTGRGLGLAAAMGIVRSHKGTIKVYSEPGQGSTFKVLLPAQDTPEPKPKPAGEDEGLARGTVLVADDEETVRIVAKRMLVRLGFDVLTAEDGREAVRMFQEHSGDIRLVLLDLTMPHLSGDQVYSEIRKTSADVPVILTSGYTKKDAITRFGGKGLVGFLQKPFRFNLMRDRIFEALKIAEVRDQPAERSTNNHPRR